MPRGWSMGGDEGLHDLTVPMRRRGGLDRIFLVLRIILLVSTRAGTIVARQPAMAGGSAGWLKRFFSSEATKEAGLRSRHLGDAHGDYREAK